MHSRTIGIGLFGCYFGASVGVILNRCSHLCMFMCNLGPKDADPHAEDAARVSRDRFVSLNTLLHYALVSYMRVADILRPRGFNFILRIPSIKYTKHQNNADIFSSNPSPVVRCRYVRDIVSV